jgi:DNA-binding response OmpR family regulator
VATLLAKRILLAEDDPVGSRLLGRALADAGAIVEIVSDGQRAKDELDLGIYDALVTDWMLPNVSGIDLVRHLQTMRFRPYVIVVSAIDVSIDDASLHAHRAGADAFFAKPLVPKMIIEALGIAIAG